MARRLYRLVSFLGFLLTVQVGADTNTVLLSTSDWPPFTRSDHKNPGIFTEVVTAAFRDMGRNPEYIFLPWKRGEKRLGKGTVFAVFPYKKTPERVNQYYFSDPILKNETRFFFHIRHLPEPPVFQQLTDLRPYSIGAVLGYSYTRDFETAGLRVKYFDTDRLNIRLLKMGRIQLTPVNTVVGWGLIREEFKEDIDQFAVLKKPLYISDMHLMVSPTYPESETLLMEFNAALKRIKDSGVFDRLVNP